MGLEVTKSSIAEWISLTQNKNINIAITLHTESGSMIPTIRMNEDTVVVIPCDEANVRVGDIVLIRKPDTHAGVLLHRLYRIGNGKIVTLGDNMCQPDREENADMLLGRAVSIAGPGKKIDCESRWRRFQGKLIVHTCWLRPFIFFVRRAFRYFGRAIWNHRI